MGKNSQLNNKKEFKYITEFTHSIIKLVYAKYPNQFFDEENNELHFSTRELDGVIVQFHTHGLHLKFSYAYIKANKVFQEDLSFNIPEINTLFNYNVNLQLLTLYPFDRDEFRDTPLGMEQRSGYFITVLQVALQHINLLKK
ncbi:hypothetical protein CLV86_2636 [Lacinutrix venerupis]|uniref:hypothetical protein n=1 Tax=Lacinutrix venerupis TaxID=1486034 RepID=UPI000EAEE89B|nr:hypothetical protein [Lacinutrix venerupis]RLJ61613.1 hypothetical protein CLV86_2636 [Lacinutrix venerupis]